MLQVRKKQRVVSDNAKILILKQITTNKGKFMNLEKLCLIMQRY